MRIKICFLMLLGMFSLGISYAQIPTVSGISRNTVSNLHGEGGRLWVGSQLNFTDDNGTTWKLAPVDSIQKGRGSVYSLDAEGQVIWVGLGYSQRQKTTDSVEPVSQGFAFSEDGGQTWKFRLPALDAPQDSLLTYGVSVIKALPVTTPVQSPPYDIDYDSGRGWIWTAGWAGGIRVSKDKGITWQRAILPPDTQAETNPNVPQNFYLTPVPRGKSRPGNENHKGFAVLVDEMGTIWAGTSGGLNRSMDGLAWTKSVYDGGANGLVGNWITSIEEQPTTGRNPVWVACWRAEQKENFGVVVTRDGGQTFEQMLHGEKIYDFAFEGNSIYAAGDNGLFISHDNGRSWLSVRDFRDTTQPDRYIRPNAKIYAVSIVNEALWVGMQDGLLRSLDKGKTWKLFRTEIPVNPATPANEIPKVETYAYPNPFSPSTDQVIRIRYDLIKAESVTIRIFDFGMNLVRTLVSGEARNQGSREELWDGRDNRGVQVANGPYFYTVSSGEGTSRGKILVLE